MELKIKSITVKKNKNASWENYYLLFRDENGGHWKSDEHNGLGLAEARKVQKEWKNAVIAPGHKGLDLLKLSGEYHEAAKLYPSRKMRLSEAELIANRLLSEAEVIHPALREYVLWLAWNPYEKRDFDLDIANLITGQNRDWREWSDEIHNGQWIKANPDIFDSVAEMRFCQSTDIAVYHLAHDLYRWRREGREKGGRDKETPIMGLGSPLFISITNLAAACAEYHLRVANNYANFTRDLRDDLVELKRESNVR